MSGGVGEGGLEPPTSCSQSRCATTAPLPVRKTLAGRVTRTLLACAVGAHTASNRRTQPETDATQIAVGELERPRAWCPQGWWGFKSPSDTIDSHPQERSGSWIASVVTT